MKKLIYSSACAAVMLVLAFASFAAETEETYVGAAAGSTYESLRQAADSLDLSHNVQAEGSEIKRLSDEGIHIFDTAGLLDEDEKSELEDSLSEVEEETDFAVAVFTADEGNSGASDIDNFADMIYYYGDLGIGEDKNGTILVIDMYERNVYIYTHGAATRYITDSMIDYIYDELDGGLYGSLADGDYAAACSIYADGVREAYEGGISSNQQNYNTETGKYDAYVKKGLTLPELIIAAVISFIIAIIPVISIRKSYAMKKEKSQAQRFNLSYRADAAFTFSAGNEAAKLINRHVSSIPIPRPVNNNRGGGGGFHGGGISSGSTGIGGSFHGGGGRSF